MKSHPEPVDLHPLVDRIDQTMEEVRAADIGDIPETERTRILGILEGVRKVVRSLCINEGADSDFPIFALRE